MKIKFWDRLILFFGALLAILAGIALFVAGLQIQGVFAETLSVGYRILCLACGVLLAAFGGYLILFPHRYAVHRHDFVVQRTEGGELRIAVKAIENMVLKCIDLHEEIRLVSMKIHNGREGVVVDLCISLANNISIPLAVASLQKQIKQYLVASSGIEVKEVRVSVESTQDDPAASVASEDDAAEKSGEKGAEKAAEAKEKKEPLHRRLFGNREQPATVPEPPKEDEDPAGGVPDESIDNAEPAEPLTDTTEEADGFGAPENGGMPGPSDPNAEETENE